MPLQCGPLFITGTIDNVCFYGMHGKYYIRMKSALTRKRVLKDPKFQLTRVHAVTLGEASKIASRVYRLITGEQKKHALYREMTGKAIYLLREGKDKEAVFLWLSGQYLEPEPVEKVTSELPKKEVVKSKRRWDIVRFVVSVPKLKKACVDPDILSLAQSGRRGSFTNLAGLEKRYALGP
jgi:hypothetical protein